MPDSGDRSKRPLLMPPHLQSLLKSFDESKHPRAADGTFANKAGAQDYPEASGDDTVSQEELRERTAAADDFVVTRRGLGGKFGGHALLTNDDGATAEVYRALKSGYEKAGTVDLSNYEGSLEKLSGALAAGEDVALGGDA